MDKSKVSSSFARGCLSRMAHKSAKRIPSCLVSLLLWKFDEAPRVIWSAPIRLIVALSHVRHQRVNSPIVRAIENVLQLRSLFNKALNSFVFLTTAFLPFHFFLLFHYY